jgi:cytochrome c-type biogenesis protein CcmE
MAAILNPKRKKRLLWVLLGVVVLGIAVGLILNTFKQNMVFFLTPTQIAQGEHQGAPDKPFRIGGMVVKGSINREPGSLKMRFVVTDFAHSIPVVYDGVVPDLFRENKGVVATGTITQGADGPLFQASEILAKHDENYMPPPVKDAMKAGAVANAADTNAAAKAAEQ